jgi:hypothetical protein
MDNDKKEKMTKMIDENINDALSPYIGKSSNHQELCEIIKEKLVEQAELMDTLIENVSFVPSPTNEFLDILADKVNSDLLPAAEPKQAYRDSYFDYNEHQWKLNEIDKAGEDIISIISERLKKAGDEIAVILKEKLKGLEDI